MYSLPKKWLVKVALVLVVTVFAVAFWFGCPSNHSEEQRVISLAKQEYTKRGGTGEVECNASKHGNMWVVTIWRLPKTPGGFVTLDISSDLKVNGYYPGD